MSHTIHDEMHDVRIWRLRGQGISRMDGIRRDFHFRWDIRGISPDWDSVHR